MYVFLIISICPVLLVNSLKLCPSDSIVCQGNSLHSCDGSQSVLQRCAEVDPSRPYCDCRSNRCVGVKPGICDYQNLELTACEIENEQFPHPFDTRQYVVCRRKRQVIKECPDNKHYMPGEWSCGPRSIHPHIRRCREEMNENIPYTGHPVYYLACRHGRPSVKSCRSHLGYTMQDNMCRFACKEEGFALDPYTCQTGRYYQCNRTSASFIKVELVCNGGRAFDLATKTCTKSALAKCPAIPDVQENIRGLLKNR